MKNKVYIASGFFTPDAMDKVIKIEEDLKLHEIDFFSPRTVTADLSPGNPKREENAKMLFKKDIDEILSCNKMHAVVDKDKDMGTLFEIGYFFGCHINNPETYDLNNLIIEGDLSEEVYWFINEFDSYEDRFKINDRTNRKNYPDAATLFNQGKYPMGSPIFITAGTPTADFMIKVIGHNPYSMDTLSEMLSELSLNNTPVLVIDDRPVEISMIMGIFYALKVPFLTASSMNFGSNIMIASSSIGHINLPAITNPYNSKIKIE